MALNDDNIPLADEDVQGELKQYKILIKILKNKISSDNK